MKLILNHRWLRSDENLSTLTSKKISKLSRLIRIDAAEVTLERNAASIPPFSARVHLVIQGPDLHTEEKDNTPEATIHRVLRNLSHQIRRRKERLIARRRDRAEERKPWKRLHQPLSIPTA